MFKISRKLKISQSGHYDGDVTSTTNAEQDVEKLHKKNYF